MAKLKLLDEGYQYPADYKFILDGKLRSPWYDLQEQRAASKQELAQEVDIDYAASGSQYFDPPLIMKWKAEYARPPLHRGDLLLKPDWEHGEWSGHPSGKVLLWFNPMADGSFPNWTDIVCGVDIATGQAGEMSSNSVASFGRCTTGELIAEYATNDRLPPDFACDVLALCHWMNNAYLVPERNGPGGQFIKQAITLGYNNLFYAKKDEIKGTGKRVSTPGFWTDRDSKKIIFSDYRIALREGKFVNRSELSLDELNAYVYDGNKIEHVRALATQDAAAVGENHGDRCISAALLWRGMQDKRGYDDKPPAIEAAIGSFAWRRKAWERSRVGARLWG